MNFRTRVIKGASRPDDPSVRDATFLDRAFRLPEKSVRLSDAPSEAPVTPARGVLRRDQTHFTDDAFTVPSRDERPPPPPPPPKAPEEPPPPDPEALKAEWDARWQQRLDEAVAQAREEGRREGMETARAEALEEIRAVHDAFSDHADRLEQAWLDFTAEAEPLMARLALTVAEAVLDAPLPEDLSRGVSQALTRACEQLAGDATLDVSLHPVDFLRLEESGLVEQLQTTHDRLRWHPAPEMQPGDWSVASPKGTIRRLREEVLHTLRLSLGLPDADD